MIFNFLKNFDNHNPFEKERRAVMEKLVKAAEENAITEAEFDEYESLLQLDEVTEDQEKRFDELHEKVEASTVRADNLNDFRYVLEASIYTPEEATELLAHENAHANKASQLGARFNAYVLKIMKKSDGEFAVHVEADIDIPDEEKGWSQAKQKQVDIAITKAPDEYGDSMSEGDKARLERIEKWYE